MAQVTLPNTISAGNAATAAEVQENFEAVRDGINAIDSTQLAAGSVTAAAIADLAVTTAKLAANAVTAAKIDAGAVGASEIADDVVNRSHIDETSMQVMHYICVDETIPNAVTTDIELSGFDKSDLTKFPVIQLWYYDTTATQWRPLMSGGGAPSAGMPTFVCLWVGTDFVVRLNQTTTANLDIRVAAIGLKAA